MTESESNIDEITGCKYYSLEDYRNLKGLVITHFNCGNIKANEKLTFEDIKKNLVSEYSK